MAQAPPPTFINLPPPGSNPETPSDMPGTPTSTTTSMSALSTTAIKDGHRGHLPAGGLGRGHQHHPSTTSLEAERADRISRLAGLERVSTVRAPFHSRDGGTGAASPSPQTTPTSTGFPAHFGQHLTPAYFDSNGQPMAATKMSTVGTASATESQPGGGSRTTAGEHDEDMFSTGTNYREAGSVASVGATDVMEDDMDGLGSRSVGGYDDRMSDDGTGSLVGFGEGAGSTVSGPIYHRRIPPGSATASQPGWGLERTVSGLSDIRRDRDTPMGSETPLGASAALDRREGRLTDGAGADSDSPTADYGEGRGFADTTIRAMHSQQGRETAERIMQRLDHGEGEVGQSALGGSSRAGEPLGKFYFEGQSRED